MESVDEGCVIIHLLKWGPLPPNEIGRIAQHVSNGKGGKEGKDGVGFDGESFL